ncbi:MAG: ImuA family protein, partial [Acetobacteraceae bacterium]
MSTFPPSSQASPLLERLRAQIRPLDQPVRRGPGVLAFGAAPIDAHLPESGLALGALHEIRGGSADAPATLFAAGLLARLEGPVLWCSAVADLFPPALAGVGLSPDRVIHAAVGDEKTVLLVMEEGLAQPGLAGVVGEIFRLPMIASRRLALAAEKSGVLALALRRGEEKKIAPIAARTRWRVSPF